MPLKSFLHGKRRVVLGIALTVVVILVAAGIIFAIRWPFFQERVVNSLQTDLRGTIRIDKFRSRVFPDPGCELEGLQFWPAGSAFGAPPIVTAQKLTIRAKYTDFVTRPGYIARIVIDGMRIEILPHASNPEPDSAENRAPTTGIASPMRNRSTGSTRAQPGKSDQTRVGEIVTNNASLEIQRQDDKPPLRFQIHSLVLHSVTQGKPFSYRLAIHTAEPPGEIVSNGSFGPWDQQQPAQTPVSGAYHFERADLSVFHGIAGTLSSDDRFSGVLGQIHVRGNIDIPDFTLTRTNHAISLSAEFEATVDAIKGDVLLPAVNASFLRTTVRARGQILGTPGQHGKTTLIELEVEKGRIENLLFFLTKGLPPALSGSTVIHAHVTVPQRGQPFLKEMMLKGDFRVTDGHFTKRNTQAKVDALSQRGLGDPKQKAPDTVAVMAEGNVSVRNGIGKFSEISLSAPGAVAKMTGTYNLITYAVDFHGELKTQAQISQTTSGFKSALLKPLNSIFRKKHAGAVIPVRMTGTYDKPDFGLNLR